MKLGEECQGLKLDADEKAKMSGPKVESAIDGMCEAVVMKA